ncbi:NADH--cytochrome b5 reductase 1 [Cocos nucifera]|uniref:cytochrome-b5 reductase n=1 Tax=Cocos nucifera TaxID=13894 RepID=A0A8K0IRQ3_COCNU|nr:NADH--cytochrome b5 reductase 1 [Cocos nucifera]
MELLQANRVEILAVAVAVGAGAAYLYLSKKPRGCLDPENFRDFKLVDKKQLSHNVAKFRFALPKPTAVLGLPIGQHISCRGKGSVGEEVIKPYTPTTLDSDVGYFELVIKMYPQGRMSHHFCEMRVGDYLSVKGPKEELDGLAQNHPNRYKVYHVLNPPPELWNGGVGFASKEMIENHCPPLASDIQVFLCGPPPMNKAMAAHLDELGCTKEMQFQF